MKDKSKTSPCDTCPYHLGIIRAFVFPCPRCMAGGFKLLEDFMRRVNGNS